MTNDQARTLLILGFAVAMPIGFYHRFRARTGESLDRRQESWPILLTLRPLAWANVIGLIAFLYKPESMAWASMHLPAWARWSGVPIGVAAVGLLTWMFRALGQNVTD